MFHRAFQSTQEIHDFIAPYYEKPKKDIEALTELFRTTFLTKHIDPSQHVVLANAMFKKEFEKGKDIIRYGDIGYEYYVLARGSCQVTVYIEGTDPSDILSEDKINFVKTMKTDPDASPPLPMVGFGEIALLYNDKRTASVTAQTECEVWTLSSDVFKHIIAQNSVRRRNISLEYLDKVELF